MTPSARVQPLGLFRVLCLLAALAATGAGAVHLLAVDAHRAHALMVVFFVATGLAQVAWGGAILFAPSRTLLLAGIAGNTAVVATWVLSRTTGVPFVPGAERAEPLGVRDVIATLLEVVAVGAVGLAVLLPVGVAAVALPAGRRAVAVVSAAVLALTGSAALAGPGHVHGSDHHAASGHGHDEAGAAHGHDEAGHDEAGHDGVGHDGAGHDESGHDEAGPGQGDADHATHPTGDGHQHGVSATGETHDHGGSGDAGHQHGLTPGHAGTHDQGTGQDHQGPDVFREPAFWGKKTTLRVGPFALPPRTLGGELHLNRPGIVSRKPCQDCYITGIAPRLVYADGSPADLETGPMLHHAVLMDTGRNDPTCERWRGVGLLGQRIFAAGNERTPLALPRGFGFRTTGAPLAYIAELMNHSDRWKSVFLEADVYHVPASRAGMKPVTPVWLDVANCGLSEYAVPAGRTSKTWGWSSSLTGRVVAAGGHVHAGGVGIVLRNAATRQRLCTSEAAYGTRGAFRGQVTDMSTCTWDSLGAVREGQSLEITSIYDTPRPLKGVMGILMLAVHETSDLRGGSPPPAWMTRDPSSDPPDSGQHQH